MLLLQAMRGSRTPLMKMMHDPGAGGPTVLQWHTTCALSSFPQKVCTNDLSMYESCGCGSCLLMLEMCARGARRGGPCVRPARGRADAARSTVAPRHRRVDARRNDV